MRGRKTLFKKTMFREGLKLSMHGFTLEELADYWDVNRTTLYRWMQRYPKFCNTIKKAKEKADRNVENKLYKRALGYEYKERTYEKRGDELKYVKRVEKQVAPDTTAQIFWLKNRQPKKWRDRRDLNLGAGEDGVPFQIMFVLVNNKQEIERVEEERKLLEVGKE